MAVMVAVAAAAGAVLREVVAGEAGGALARQCPPRPLAMTSLPMPISSAAPSGGAPTATCWRRCVARTGCPWRSRRWPRRACLAAAEPRLPVRC